MQGRLVAGVEAGCLLVATKGGDYLLLGGPRDVEKGSVVRVVGRVVTGTASYCMQGTPLRVESLRVLSVATP